MLRTRHTRRDELLDARLSGLKPEPPESADRMQQAAPIPAPYRGSDPRTAIPRRRLTAISVRYNLRLVMTNRSLFVWDVLGDATRRAIFERLADRPRAVGELAAELPVSRPAVSQHLKVLKDAGLVIDRAIGTRRIYRLNPDGLGALRAQIDQFWSRTLATYKEVAEQRTKRGSHEN